MHRYALLFLISLAFHAPLAAGDIEVYGKAQKYAGKELTFKTYADYITRTETVIAQTKVDSAGTFRLTFTHNKPVYSFTDLGQYRCYIVLRPGQSYHVTLPPKKELTRQQKLDPYFRRRAYYLKLVEPDSNDVNVRINQFDHAFDELSLKVTMQKFRRKSLQDIDSVIHALDQKFPAPAGSYFHIHKHFRFAYLTNVTFGGKPTQMLRKDFREMPVAFFHPVYNEVFSDVSFDYLQEIVTKGKLDIPFSNYYSARALMQHVNRSSLFANDSLRELFILNALHDGYYENYFHHRSVAYVSDSLAKHGKSEYISQAAARIKEEITRLQEGYPAPGFSLPDQDSIIADLDMFRGKFILLHFHSSESYTAVKQLPLLKKIYKDFKKQLAIVTISTDKRFERVKQMAKKNEYEWTFLHYQSGSEVLEDYNVVAYPTYYLLGPNGKLLLSPAPEPGKELAGRLGEMIMKARRERLRQNGGKSQNTFSPR